MTWIILFLVLAVAIGPVFYLLPSAKDKRLVVLREQARKAGMTVQITSLPKLDPSAHERVTAGGKTLDPRVACVAYKVPIGANLKGLDGWVLLKVPAAPSITLAPVVPGWALEDADQQESWQVYKTEGGMSDTAVSDNLVAELARLPKDTLAVGVDGRFVACYWLEKSPAEGDGVMEIYAVLDRLREDLCRRFRVAES